jgi:hypothetical protein
VLLNRKVGIPQGGGFRGGASGSILVVVKEYGFGSQIFKKEGIFLRTYSFFYFVNPGFQSL